MKKILNIYKPTGLTPLQVLDNLRRQAPSLTSEKLTYSGRLDPMARGVMLVLVGEEGKNQKTYHHLYKTYQFNLILGITTDTYDPLGRLQDLSIIQPPTNLKTKLSKSTSELSGKHSQSYPPYSYIKVNGKPLWHWAKVGKLDKINIPSKQIEIYTAKLKQTKTIKLSTFISNISKQIASIDGDFRQQEIISDWNKLLQNELATTLTTTKITITCSSGTYIRSIAHNIGQQLGCGALAHDIFRTKVGEYNYKDSLKLK